MNQFDPEKFAADDAHAKTLVRFKEHFNAKSRREAWINNSAFVIGGGASLLITKHRTHNLAAGALSYIIAVNLQTYMANSAAS